MNADDIIELAPPSMDLVDEFHAALVESFEEHAKYLKWAESDPDISMTASNMADAIARFHRKEQELRFIVLRRSNRRILGCIGLILRDLAIPYFEIGYWVRSSESGKGYISRAVNLIEQFAVNEFCVRRLEIKMSTSNLASRRVAERAGFTLEATHVYDRMLPSGEVTGTHVFCKLYS